MRLRFKIFILMLVKMFGAIIAPLFSTQKNKIIFCSWDGNGRFYSCSPKYIYKEFIKINKKFTSSLDIIWIIGDNDNIDIDTFPSNVRFVKRKSLSFIYHTLRCRVYVTNTGFPVYIPFKKNRYVINTWHGGGAYKKVGIDTSARYKSHPYVVKTKNRLTSLWLSSSKYFTEQVIRQSMCYKGEVLEIGLPRNDILMENKKLESISSRIKKQLNIDNTKKILLWAPTYRGATKKLNDNKFIEDFDLERCLIELKKKFNESFCVIYRSHQYSKKYKNNKLDIIDGNIVCDMQELLCAADVLITDYSSSMWDFSLTGKPGFLFTPDVEHYIKERGFYTDIKTWPYSYAKTNDELMSDIDSYDKKISAKKIQKHYDILCGCESGYASKTAARKIYDIIIEEI